MKSGCLSLHRPMATRCNSQPTNRPIVHEDSLELSEDLPCLTCPTNILEIVALFSLTNMPCSLPCL